MKNYLLSGLICTLSCIAYAAEPAVDAQPAKPTAAQTREAQRQEAQAIYQTVYGDMAQRQANADILVAIAVLDASKVQQAIDAGANLKDDKILLLAINILRHPSKKGHNKTDQDAIDIIELLVEHGATITYDHIMYASNYACGLVNIDLLNNLLARCDQDLRVQALPKTFLTCLNFMQLDVLQKLYLKPNEINYWLSSYTTTYCSPSYFDASKATERTLLTESVKRYLTATNNNTKAIYKQFIVWLLDNGARLDVTSEPPIFSVIKAQDVELITLLAKYDANSPKACAYVEGKQFSRPLDYALHCYHNACLCQDETSSILQIIYILAGNTPEAYKRALAQDSIALRIALRLAGARVWLSQRV